MKTALLQRASHLYHLRALRRFEAASGDVEKCQRAVFARLMKTFAQKKYFVPQFETYEGVDLPIESFEVQAAKLKASWKEDERIVWQPTSGSTGGRKWIPYTADFRSDTQVVASTWLADLGRLCPGILKGSHYWSLSWLPDELREKGDNDDSRFLPAWQRWIMKEIFAVPSSVQSLPTNEESWFATLVYLANDESLSLISVWSPTFALRLLDDIRTRRDEIRRDGEAFLAKRNLPASRRRLTPFPKTTEPDFYSKLWPRLALVSSWDSATSESWAQKLKARLPHVAFQGKGLWATEGPVTFPIGGEKVLCANSHFFEFRRFDTGEILPAWKLRIGDEVQPLLWSSNGLARLPLPDRVRVTGFYRTFPCLEFVSRLASTDLVGEKIEAEHASRLLSRAREAGVATIGLFAVKTERRYVMATLGNTPSYLDEWLEDQLSENHHYSLARQLGQLERASVRRFASFEEFENSLCRNGLVQGQLKIEALRSIDSLTQQEPKALGREMAETQDD